MVGADELFGQPHLRISPHPGMGKRARHLTGRPDIYPIYDSLVNEILNGLLLRSR